MNNISYGNDTDLQNDKEKFKVSWIEWMDNLLNTTIFKNLFKTTLDVEEAPSFFFFEYE